MNDDTKKELSAMRRMGTIMEPLSPVSRARVLAWLVGVYRTAPEHQTARIEQLPVLLEVAKDETCAPVPERGDYRTIRKRGQTTKL